MKYHFRGFFLIWGQRAEYFLCCCSETASEGEPRIACSSASSRLGLRLHPSRGRSNSHAPGRGNNARAEVIIEPPVTQRELICSYSCDWGAGFVSTAESLILAVSGIALERLTVILQVHKKQVKNVTLHSTHTYTECCWRNNSGC